MHDGGLARERIGFPGHAVVEAHADGQHEVAGRCTHIGCVSAVHSDHPEKERIRARERAQAHQRTFGEDNPPSGKDQRALGRLEKPDHFAQLLLVRPVGRVVRAQVHLPGGREVGFGAGDVFRDVDEHRPGPARAGEVEGFLEDPGQVGDRLDEVVVLGAGARDADDVHFLESVVADEMGRHLAGEHDDGDGVGVGRGDPGHRVGGPGPGGDQAHPHFAARPGIAVGGVHRALLMPDQYVTDVGSRKLVVNVDDGPSGKTEKSVHVLVFQDRHQDLSACQHHVVVSGSSLSKKKPATACGAGNGFFIFGMLCLHHYQPLVLIAANEADDKNE